jgi:endonuclease/exonuclease/phosphatase family metal-dependent hydrolase
VNVTAWNLAGRLRRIPQQCGMLASRQPDVVALQEVTQPGLAWLRMLLAHDGFTHRADSFELAPCPALLTGPRRYGLLIASRYPIHPWQPGRFNVPWPERILSMDIDTPSGPVEVYITHIPPGVTNGWIKIEMLEGLYTALAHPSTTSRILCGDFNTPQLERSTGEIVTWGQRINSTRVAVIRKHIRGGEGARWDRGER